MLSAGQRIGDYEVLAKFRAGGMATLYLARRRGVAGFSRLVALKVVHEHLSHDERFVDMFVEEAKLSACIRHPNVVHIEELSEHEGTHFLAMEFVAGCSLRQLLRALAQQKLRLTPDVAVYIAVRVADGLYSAHGARSAIGEPLQLVHRDVNPANILLAYQGHVKLIDFGIAKAKGRAAETNTSLKGKVRYMSPEQAQGDIVDQTTDVYALGVTLWEMLAMRRRFGGENELAVLDEVRAPQPSPVSEYNPNVSEALSQVLDRALSPNPAERFGSAQQFRRALVAAQPRAMVVDASQLEDLLGAIMTDDIEALREKLTRLSATTDLDLPQSATAKPGRVAEAVAAMTSHSEDNHGHAHSILDSESMSMPTSSYPKIVPQQVISSVDTERPTRSEESTIEGVHDMSGRSRALLAAVLGGCVVFTLIIVGMLTWWATRDSEQGGAAITPIPPVATPKDIPTSKPAVVPVAPPTTSPPPEPIDDAAELGGVRERQRSSADEERDRLRRERRRERRKAREAKRAGSPLAAEFD